MANFDIVEAGIEELADVLASGTITSVELVALYLRRISTYDCRGISLNSIPILNTNVFEEAAASDDRRLSGNKVGLLEGIPYTVKDSYKVQSMTVACGSPAFEHLIANEDAFTVSAIRNAGGVLIGRTNMPPMAYGGMQRGIYGRAESPYNPKYLAAAFWSGSSNGSGVATAASFAAFGMGEETVSSGRSPASNNGLVAYTPSRGWLSIRGNWPLYPTCDVVVPHTRTMRDMLALLDVIAAEDPITEGDFWREQPYVQLEKPWSTLNESFRTIGQCKSLAGVRIAVPEMYVGGPAPTGAEPVTTCAEVIELWQEAKGDLEALGAEVVAVPDFPVVTAYENSDLLPDDCPRRPNNWHAAERGPLIAHAWNGFLHLNKDPSCGAISSTDPLRIYPESLRTAPELKFIDRNNAIRYSELAESVRQSTLYEVKDLKEALLSLEGMRRVLLEDWLTSLGCHCAVFPAAGDVAAANADVDEESAEYAWRNGVFYSNGNKALRHLGVPTVSIPMGVMKHKHMPVNLTFAGKAYDDANLLRYGNAYENRAKKRIPPPLTPPLKSNTILKESVGSAKRASRPTLCVEKCQFRPARTESLSQLQVSIEGTISISDQIRVGDSVITPELEVTVDAYLVQPGEIYIEAEGKTLFRFRLSTIAQKPIDRDERTQTQAPVARDKTMIVILARAGPGGQPTGWLQVY